MNKIDVLEETKRKIIMYIENDQFTQKELDFIIKECLIKLTDCYKKMGCYNSTINEYIEGKKVEMSQYIKQNIHDKRKTSQENEVQGFFSKMEKDLEEQDEINENEISRFEIRSNNRDYTLRVNSMIKDAIYNIQSTQNRILGFNRVPYARIEKIQTEVLAFINSYGEKNEEKIYKALNENDNRITNKIIEEVKTSINEIRIISGNKENTSDGNNNQETKKDSFREELEAGISYEEQRANAQEFVNKNDNNENRDNEEKGLPDNLLE